MAISPKQARAARAHLGIEQKDVHAGTGISINQISTFERETAGLSAANLQKLEAYYHVQGIDFTDSDGVRSTPKGTTQEFHGATGFREFMDDVYKIAKDQGGDICLFNSKPSVWYKWLGEEWYAMHAARMKALGDSVRVRITVQEGEDFFILNSAEHRWFGKDVWKEKILYVYGPKIGFLDFSDNDIRITVFNQADFAESFRVLFDIAWDHATPPVITNNKGE